MANEEPTPTAGDVNWEAYSHEELYRMLWQDADVADVGAVATEWSQHRVALETHAEVLREQRVALLDSWQGPAAEEAADRLAALAARVEKIAELAQAGQRAAQEAADALATARAMMPPPPAGSAAPNAGETTTSAQPALGPAMFGLPGSAGTPVPTAPAGPATPASPTTPATQALPAAPIPAPPAMPTFPTASTAPAFPAAPAMPAVPGVSAMPALPSAPTMSTASFSAMPNFAAPAMPNFAAPAMPNFAAPAMPNFAGPAMPNFAGMFTPAPTTTTSGMGTAFGAVGSAGFSFYFGAVSTDQQKAEAVRAMRAYESSLAGGSRLIDGARGAIPPAASAPRADAPTASGVSGGGASAGARGGVPWSRLLGGGRSPGGGMASVVGGPAPAVGQGVQLAPGPRTGVLPGTVGGLSVPVGHLAGESAAARGTGQAAMAAPVGGRANGAEDQPYENRMPTIDHGLFTVDLPVSPAVIGDTTGAQA